MLSQFENMWDRYLGSIKAVQRGIEVDKTDTQPVHLGSNRKELKGREFEKQELYPVLAMDVIEHVQTEWALPIVFVPKKDKTLCFCVD